MMRKLFSTTSWGTDFSLFLIRLVFGGLMLFNHGLPKLLSFSEKSAVFPDPLRLGSTVSLGLTVFAEFFCAAFIILGLFTRLSLIPLIITMLVAFFVFHGGDPIAEKEMATIYGATFIILFISGPGKLSLDQLFQRNKRI